MTVDYTHYPSGPKTCECGHSKFVHINCFAGKCVKPNCPCQQYRRQP